MIARRLAVLLIAFSLFPGTSGAQDPAPLGLDEAVGLALRTTEEVRIARLGIDEARLQRSKALQSVTPDLSLASTWGAAHFTGGGEGSGDTRDSSSYTLALNQPFYTGGRATSAMRMADHSIVISRLAHDLSREGVYLAVVEAYLGGLAAERVVEAARLGLTQAGDFLNLARRRFELGEVTRTTILRAEFELARRQAALSEAERNRRLSGETLRKLTGREVNGLVDIDPASWPTVPAGVEELVASALLHRRDLLIDREGKGIAEEGVVSARGKFLPFVFGSASYSRIGAAFPPADSESWGVALNLQLALYDRGQSLNDLRLAKLALEKSRLAEQGSRKAIRLDVENRYLRLETLRTSTASLRAQVALAEENYRGLRKQWEVGLSTDLEVMTALLDEIGARVQLAREGYDLLLAVLQLRQAAGVLDLPVVAPPIGADSAAK